MNHSERLWKELIFSSLITLVSCLALLWLAACSTKPQSDQQIKQQAAQTTEQVKAGAKQAAADAKVAAANAERKANDIAAGVKQGLHNNASPKSSGSVDINSASQARLTALPGITAARARRIINNRPYASPHDLVSKGVLTRAEYDQISGQIVASND
jgi:DNA uptake protein ComE-like DNA-binding protein